MRGFANAGPALGGEAGWPALFWLAGLLEGEGSFLRPVPSSPSCPIVSCRMTDLDIVELVAEAFGTSVQSIDKGRYRTEYAAMVRGSRAAELMRLLRPMMGDRRRMAIDRALRDYRPPARKLDFEKAEGIRRRRSGGMTISSLARTFRVSRPTIRAVLTGRFYPEPENGPPWLPLSQVIRGAIAAGTGLNWKELYWLAGWLEGEGSFNAPPPSSPRRPRIQATCSDQDVISEVSRLLRVKARAEGSRKPEWSPLWRVLLAGGRAMTLMEAIRPVMGTRRQAQVDAAIDAALKAGARPGWHERYSFRRPRLTGAVTRWTRGESNPCPRE
jgi:hypothetical protein